MNLEKIVKTLKDYFKTDNIPNPHNYPESFLFYVTIYQYLKRERK